MLDGARNADCHIEFGGDDLASLANLIVVRRITGIDGGARGANGGTQLVGERIDELVEFFRRTQRPTTRDDDLGGSQFRARRGGQLGTGKGRKPGITGAAGRFDGGAAATGRCLGKGSAAHGDDFLGIRRLDGRNGVTGVNRPSERIRALDRQDLGNLRDIERCRHPRRDILATRRCRCHECIITGHQSGDQRRKVFG